MNYNIVKIDNGFLLGYSQEADGNIYHQVFYPDIEQLARALKALLA